MLPKPLICPFVKAMCLLLPIKELRVIYKLMIRLG